MPTREDAYLDNKKAVLVASIIDGLKINFGQIIADEIFVRAHKIARALPFSCLITDICWQANVPIIKRMDNEIQTFRRQDIKRSKDDSKFEMRVHKLPVYETHNTPTPEASDVPSCILLPIVTYVP